MFPNNGQEKVVASVVCLLFHRCAIYETTVLSNLLFVSQTVFPNVIGTVKRVHLHLICDSFAVITSFWPAQQVSYMMASRIFEGGVSEAVG